MADDASHLVAVFLDHIYGDRANLDAVNAGPPRVRGMTPKQELAELKAGLNGGFALAEKMLCPWLQRVIRVWYYVTKAAWSFYTHHGKITPCLPAPCLGEFTG